MFDVDAPQVLAFPKVKEVHFEPRQFWEVEECKLPENIGTHVCEILFAETTYTNPDNYFVVKLPIKEDPKVLGNSKRLALKRLFAMEKKLNNNDKLKTMYTESMREYQALGHMSEVSYENEHAPSYYIPHLGVLRENSLTTKLRVVFDASAKSSSGKSLNDILHVGPTIQDTLFDIILRFREYPFVITADITKMYRMILIAPEDRSLQRILWRENPNDSVKVFELNTVTYGTGPAPFLAIRALQESANIQEENLPIGAYHVKKSFYVDDFLGGADTVEEARQVKKEVEAVTSSNNFLLRKWASNDSGLVK